MKLKIVQRSGFLICGYAVETNAANSNADVSKLYTDFFNENREKMLMNLSGSKKGYYGLMWYTSEHERYCYMLGLEVSEDNLPPKDTILKAIPPADFAVAEFSGEDDNIKAWTEFFYTAIPAAGYAPDKAHGYYFEYYPESVNGKYELWTPVVRANV